jgi:hypothetical protein
MNFEDYGSIVATKCRIILCGYLLEKLKVDGSCYKWFNQNKYKKLNNKGHNHSTNTPQTLHSIYWWELQTKKLNHKGLVYKLNYPTIKNSQYKIVLLHLIVSMTMSLNKLKSWTPLFYFYHYLSLFLLILVNHA